MSDELLDSLRVERFTHHDLCGDFDCGEPDLTAYLVDGTAANDQLAAVSRCYLVRTDAEELVGYFAVLADSIRLSTKERPDGVYYQTAPAIKLGRMGVGLAFRRQGVGTWILDYVVGMARELSGALGVRYVTLDALNKPALVGWYEGYGFITNRGEASLWDAFWESIGRARSGDPHTISMRYDVLLQTELPAE